MEYSTVYDISVLLGEESIDFPGDAPYSRELVSTTRASGICNISKLIMSAHAGTHIDAPAHFIEGGGTLDSYVVQDFILPAQIVEIENGLSICADELKKLHILDGGALLFKTDNSVSGRCRNGQFSGDFVYLTPEAAEFCVEKKCRLVGIDYITIDMFGDDASPAHRKLLGNNIFILEGLNLHAVPPGEYTLFSLPLKIKGGEGSPVRAILLK